MANLLLLLLQNPLSTVCFSYSFTIQAFLILLRRALLPHIPSYQSLRLQLQRAYLSSCSINFPDLVHRLPVGPCPENRARRVGMGWTGYVIPGTTSLKGFGLDSPECFQCVALYAHGGGYARGEAKMYLNYMERWTRVAAKNGLNLTFLSVEYPLTDEAPHPAQREAFLNGYSYLLKEGVQPKNIIFMGDSAGGGLCVLSSIELMRRNLPQPAGSVLLSPWIDMSLRSHEGGNALVETDYLVNANKLCPVYAARWLNGRSGTSTEVNPLFYKAAQIQGLNPQLILTGAGEFALQESKDFATLCNEASIPHELVLEWGQLHIYALGSKWVDPVVRERTDAKIVGWMLKCLESRKSESEYRDST